MDEQDTAAKIGNGLVVLSAERPAYLKRVYRDRERTGATREQPSVIAGTAPDIQTPQEAWDRLVGELSPVEWLELDGPHTLERIVRYLDPSEFDHIRGPVVVPDEIERNRLAVLLWRQLALHRGPQDAIHGRADVSAGARRERG